MMPASAASSSGLGASTGAAAGCRLTTDLSVDADLPPCVDDHRRRYPARRGAVPLNSGWFCKLQPADDPLGQPAASENAVLRVVVRIAVLPEHRIVRVEVADRDGTAHPG